MSRKRDKTPTDKRPTRQKTDKTKDRRDITPTKNTDKHRQTFIIHVPYDLGINIMYLHDRYTIPAIIQYIRLRH